MPYPICVVCHIELDNPDTFLFTCPECHRRYILDYEVMAYDDSVGTAYDDESTTIETEGLAGGTGPRLDTQGENELDYFPSLDEQMEQEYEDQEGKIPIPKYMKDSETTKVIEYREEEQNE